MKGSKEQRASRLRLSQEDQDRLNLQTIYNKVHFMNARAALLARMRREVGISLKRGAEMLEVKREEFQAMENGTLEIDDAQMAVMEVAFIRWRDFEIARLHKVIETLQSII